MDDSRPLDDGEQVQAALSGTGIDIRHATAEDAGVISEMVGLLAEYERLADLNRATADSLCRELADSHGVLKAVIAFCDGHPAGMATFFQTYSTFAAKRGLYLEDIYVRNEYRHRGIGTALLRFVARFAAERDFGRMEWTTLLWNTPSIEFYESLGATPNDAWTTYRLSGESLQKLATPERALDDQSGS